MSETCKINRANKEIIKDTQEIKDLNAIADMLIVDESTPVGEYLAADYSAGQLIPGEVLDETFDKMYGKKNIRKARAAIIHAVISANPGIKLMANDFIKQHIDRDTYFIDGKIDIAAMSEGTTKIIMQAVLDMAGAVTKTGLITGNFGGLIRQIKTPKQVGLADPTGSYYNIATKVAKYATNTGARIELFFSNHKKLNRILGYKTGDDKRLSMNMQQVLDGITEIVNINGFYTNTIDGRRILDAKDRADALFHRYMMGWIYYDEQTKQFMIYSDWRPINKKDNEGNDIEGQFEFYPKTNEVRYSFHEPVPLKEYTPPEGQKGDWYLELNDSQKGKFFHYAEEGRKIDDAAFEYMEMEMKKSVDFLLEKMSKMFNDKYTTKQLRAIFLGGKLAKKVIPNLPDDEVEMIKRFKNIFGMNINDEFVLESGATAEKRSNHWPIRYNKDNFTFMIDSTLERMRLKTLSLMRIMDNPNKFNKLSVEGKKNLDKQITGLQAGIRALEGQKEGYNGQYGYDQQNDIVIPFASHNKYAKRISNAYDIRHTRAEKAVYNDYLRQIMSTVERNILTGHLLESMRLAFKADNDNTRDVLIETAVNLYKVPFAPDDLRGPGGITTEGVTNVVNFFNKGINLIPGVHKVKRSPGQVNQSMRSVGSFLSGSFLSEISTALTNVSGAYQNVSDYGMDQLMSAWNILSDDTLEYRIDEKTGQLILGEDNKPILLGKRNELIEQMVGDSGITSFNEFFSRAQVNGLLKAQVENKTADAILHEMVMYHNLIKKGTSLADAQKIFTDNVSNILSNSSSFMKAKDIEIKNISEIKEKQMELRKDRTKYWTNRLVQWAITKELEFNKMLDFKGIKKLPWIKKPGALIKMPIQNIVKTYSDMIKGNKWFVMSDGEAFVRTISFIIGLNRMQKQNLLPGHTSANWWQYTDPEMIDKALDFGVNFSNFTNFGLSSQDVGQMNWNGLGNLMGKFKYFSQQQTGRHFRIIKEAYYSMKSDKKILGQGTFLKHFDIKAVLKLIYEAGLPGGAMTPWVYAHYATGRHRKQRTVNPAVAQVRNLFALTGFITLVWDVLMSPFLRIPGTRNMVKWIVGFKQTRSITSDAMSWMMLPMTLSLKFMLWGGLTGEDEPDEEDWVNFLQYYGRKTMMGYLPNLGFDFILGVLVAMTGEMRDLARHITNMSVPATGGMNFIGKGIRAGLEPGLEYILDN